MLVVGEASGDAEHDPPVGALPGTDAGRPGSEGAGPSGDGSERD